MESLRYADALIAYEQAYTLTHDPALLYNQGRAEQALGQFPAALASFERFATDAPPELRARVPLLDELLAEVRKHVAHLGIRCDTQGARVLVRDRVVGTTPLSGPLELNAGYAAVEVDAEGYQPFRREIDLVGASQVILDVSLVPEKLVAFLRVVSQESSAFVSIDGQPIGNAPVEVVVAPGTHRVAVHHGGFADASTSVVLALGERKEVSLDQERNPPITKKWWFWTGVGAVVTAGVVTAAALLIERAPSHGDSFTPDQVSAPLTRF